MCEPSTTMYHIGKKKKRSYAHSIRTHIYVTLHYTYVYNIVTDQTVVPNCNQIEVQHA